MQGVKQTGFTLFEIAFAIAIVCLVGVTVAIVQNLAVNAKVDRLDHDFRTIETAIDDALDGLRVKRGDIRKVSMSVQDLAVLDNRGDRNVVLEGEWKSTSGETFQLWRAPDRAGSGSDPKETQLNAHIHPRSPGA